VIFGNGRPGGGAVFISRRTLPDAEFDPSVAAENHADDDPWR
jgi:hypothetical protein